MERLYFCDAVRVDSNRIDTLTAELGPSGAERVIGRAMEEIAVRLTRIENAYDHGSFDKVRKCARSLIGICDQTGLTTVRDAAEAVWRLCDTTDSAALGACVARLVRVGEMSLVTVWDAHDVSL